MSRYIVLLLCVVLSTPVWAMGNAPSRTSQEQISSQMAPDFTLPTTSGGNLSLAQARAGKKAILFFWATWCPHCREEIERLRQTLDVFKNKNIQILLVNVGQSKEEAQGYLKNQGLALESFIDADNAVAQQYSVEGIPTLYFIDEQGMIRGMDHEIPSDYEARFK